MLDRSVLTLQNLIRMPRPKAPFFPLRVLAGGCKAYPIADHATVMQQGLEALSMCALFFQRSDDPLDYTVLQRPMRRNKLLAQAIVAILIQTFDADLQATQYRAPAAMI